MNWQGKKFLSLFRSAKLSAEMDSNGHELKSSFAQIAASDAALDSNFTSEFMKYLGTESASSSHRKSRVTKYVPQLSQGFIAITFVVPVLLIAMLSIHEGETAEFCADIPPGFSPRAEFCKGLVDTRLALNNFDSILLGENGSLAMFFAYVLASICLFSIRRSNSWIRQVALWLIAIQGFYAVYRGIEIVMLHRFW